MSSLNWDLAVSLAPIVILIYMMTKKNGVPSYVALPITALLVYLIKLVYFSADPNLINATIINGLLTAWVPIFIIWGAILLFKTMERTGAMDTVHAWLNGITTNPVGQLMIIGWAFAFLIEGASGFGTPAAIAAPILVGMGFKPLPVACLTLVMNSVPVTFGAVGTPTWFGMGQLNLPPEQILHIGVESAILHGAAALVIPVIALSFVVSWKEIGRNIGFVYASILSCVIPYILLALVNYEFPSLVGGMIGLILSVLMAERGIGLSAAEPNAANLAEPAPGTEKKRDSLAKASFPIWGTIAILVLTRIPQLGLKGLLNTAEPAYDVALGTLGEIRVSAALVLTLSNIFGADSTWSFNTLYIPAFIPFFLVSAISLILFKAKPSVIKAIWLETVHRMTKPILALLGALVMVKLITVGGEKAMTITIGQAFARLFEGSWQFFASYLGALGAFFSGSNTVSNLTFAGIQQSIAKTLGLDASRILALQSVGGAMGNMVCINNIVAVCSILGLVKKEGFILKKTVLPMLLYGIIVGIFGLFL
jgi:lactate permease